ncbi:aldehyde dehydrogenase family protein [Leucobacter luti]|uniref:Succinate-semialdehyde dehydrogenase/glutarate-semialdehyde dehydrogenase n=1 Tax=Leucobacter luti TaxID=340320 RepID=A0A4Q7TYF9_9MICO|nr:aldehyde dehydrogenase family protein [Leucobacter luti]MBL3698858.1 aldehyde dehydrogenase family protein [Leucobacter luti]RZT66236.1 succinate-semialdehyde dehydrogenase/glutarate-semialdehyde dehydrogenase [Leucobacter luti]
MSVADAAVRSTLDAAHAAYRAWRGEDPAARAAVLARAAELYDARAEHLAEVMAREMGKPVRQGRAETRSCSAILRFYAEHSEELLRPEPVPLHGGGAAPGTEPPRAAVELAPTGVVFGVMPWNYPHYQLIRVIAPNLLLGNAVVFKHAAICPETARLVAELFADAGAPEALVSDSAFTHDQAYAAIADPIVTGVSFTGGERAGAAIARAAGAALTKVVLELGGNDPFVVFDADRVDELAALAAQLRLSNAGQTCVSPKRIIVREELLPRFLDVFSERFLAVAPGDPLSEDTELGPLASAAAADELRGVLRDARDSGATVLGDAADLDRSGRALAPHIVVNPDRRHAAWTEELFGPVAVIAGARDAAHAVALANDSAYGLGATVFARDPQELVLFRSEIECGMYAENGLKGGDPRLPFGGVKRSGIGRELGALGLREFANQRLVVTHA